MTPIDKQQGLTRVLQSLKEQLDLLVKSAFEAKEFSTNEESKAENKYDTRGLEASYLAGAQAKRAREVEKILETLKKTKPKVFNSDSSIEGTALIETQINGDEAKWFFFLPNLGGLKVSVNNKTIHTISPESPIGSKLLEKKVGDFFEIKISNNLKEYEILNIF